MKTELHVEWLYWHAVQLAEFVAAQFAMPIWVRLFVFCLYLLIISSLCMLILIVCQPAMYNIYIIIIIIKTRQQIIIKTSFIKCAIGCVILIDHHKFFLDIIFLM